MTLSRRMARQLVVSLIAAATVAGGASTLARASQSPAALGSAFRQLPTVPVLNGVWCAGPTRCLAVGYDEQGAPISMAWNGQHWRYVTTPAVGQSLDALACTAWTHCMALGYPGVADEWNGTSWRALHAPTTANLRSVACPAARICVAVGLSNSAKEAAAIVWNGRTWRSTAVPFPAHALFLNLESVACPSVTYCIAVGDYLKPTSYSIQIAMTWNGARWRLAPTPPEKAYTIACPRLNLCVAVSSNQSLMWNRHSWRQVWMPAQNTPESISCPETSFCMMDSQQVTAAWNGRSWSRIKPADNDTYALWCGSAKDCMAVGGGSRGGNASQWNGSSWRALQVTKVDNLGEISCATTTDCIAIGTSNALTPPDSLAEKWSGTAWTVMPGPSISGHIGLTPVSCPTTSFCMAMTNSAAQWWDGSTWHSTSVPTVTGLYPPPGLSCTGQDNCVAVGTDAAVVWSGSTWKTTDVGISGQTVVLTGVSCAGAMCMASGYSYINTCQQDCVISFLAEEWNGSTWTITDDVLSGTNPWPYSSISCPTSTFCMEAGFAGSARTWNGKSWQSVPGDLPVVDSLSCFSATSCLTVGSLPTGPSLALKTYTETWNGASWRVAKSVPIGDGLESVSCPGASTCIATGFNDKLLAVAQAWNGTNWRALAPVHP